MGNKFAYPEINLSGKVALVTGGNTGIGYETAKGLARLGAHTFIACRSKERAETAVERMKNELSQPRLHVGEPANASSNRDKITNPHEDEKERTTVADNKQSTHSIDSKEVKVEYIPLDLASFQSTKECVRIFKERDLPLHILVNNAAVGPSPFTITEDNLESQFQINHLGPMLLTLELLPILLDTAASSGDVRILFVSSALHFHADHFNSEELNKMKEQYRRIKMYSNTKLYNVMTGYALQRRLQNKGITVSSLHPGMVQSEITRSFQDEKLLWLFFEVSVRVIGITSVKGAATSLNCAVKPELNSQQHLYYDSCRLKIPSTDSRNETFQEKLWKKSFEFLNGHVSLYILEKYGPKPEERAPEGTDVSRTMAEANEKHGSKVQELQKTIENAS